MYRGPAMQRVAYLGVGCQSVVSLWLDRSDRLFVQREVKVFGCVLAASCLCGSMARLRRTIDTSRRFLGSRAVEKFFGVLASLPRGPPR
jgi:hypothetical protein